MQQEINTYAPNSEIMDELKVKIHEKAESQGEIDKLKNSLQELLALKKTYGSTVPLQNAKFVTADNL